MAPSDSTVCRVLMDTDPDALQEVLSRWAAPRLGAADGPPALAADGKRIRGANRHTDDATYFEAVTLVTHAGRPVASRCCRDEGGETAALRALPGDVDLRGCVLTLDALHATRDTGPSSRRTAVGGEAVRAHLFVATPGYSRRIYVKVFAHERQSAWFAGLEGAFLHFGGVPDEVLVDNPKPLVARHDPATREVEFNERFAAFAAHWGFRPRACAPYRARTKGKDENGVRYVKRNAIAGRRFESLAALEGHLAWWMREIADARRHGTTGETPRARFEREADRLSPCAGTPPFGQLRDLIRTVHADCAVTVDTNAYSVPWRLIGERVRVVVSGGRVRVHRGAEVVADHGAHDGRHARIVDRAHFEGVNAGLRPADAGDAAPEPELLRPLDEYAAVAGGRF